MAKKNPETGLTNQQEAFAREYAKDFNGQQAAERAGYAKKGARVTASRLLTKVNVQNLIAQRTKQRAEEAQVDSDQVFAELVRLGFSNMLDYIAVDEHGHVRLDLKKVTREQAAAIQEVIIDNQLVANDGEQEILKQRVKFKLADKKGSLDLLNKMLGSYAPEKREHSGPGGQPLTTHPDLSKLTSGQLKEYKKLHKLMTA